MTSHREPVLSCTRAKRSGTRLLRRLARTERLAMTEGLREISREITPSRVLGFDQSDLARSRAGLDLLFATNGVDDVFERLVIDELSHVVASGEGRGIGLRPMLTDAHDEIRGDACVQNRTIRVRQYVNGTHRKHLAIVSTGSDRTGP